MPTFLNPIVAITPGATGSWQDVDLSAYCPAGTTGVAIKVYNANAAARAIGWRRKGSTDDRYTTMYQASHFWGACGVDSNRMLQFYVGTDVTVWLVGYFGAEAVFFTNAPNKSFATTGSWETVDISGDVNVGDIAQLAFLDARGIASHNFGLRKKGSTDSVATTCTGDRAGIVGVDSNNQFECYIGNSADDIFLNGYIRAGATMAENATDVTPGSTGSYVDLAALPAGAIAGVYRLWTSTASYYDGIRMNGAAEDTYTTMNRHAWAVVKADINRVVEAKINNVASSYCKIYLLGYFTDLPTPAITNLSSASGYIGDSVTITGTGFNASQDSGAVQFNGTTATITSWSDTSIVCTVPAGATTGNIVVTNLWGNASTGTVYTVKSLPTATAIGSGCTGDDVTIDGTDFGAAQGTVTFDATAASIVSWADGQIVVTVPVGAVDCTVTVTNGDGKTCTVAFTLGTCGGVSSTPETPIHTGNPIGTGANLGLSPVR